MTFWSLSPLVPSAESLAYRDELRRRPELDDDAFYRRLKASCFREYGQTTN
jgi:hypothetical protein